jgi:hypothetical protein
MPTKTALHWGGFLLRAVNSGPLNSIHYLGDKNYVFPYASVKFMTLVRKRVEVFVHSLVIMMTSKPRPGRDSRTGLFFPDA